MVAIMASEAETRINLTALQRQDPYISNILDSATQVAVYTFNHGSGEWEKTEMEGTLFVYSRIAPPTTGFTIMNQLSMENLTEALTADLEFQNQDPFLLYRNAKLMIYGLWFYDMYDCTRIGKLLINLCKGEKPSAPNKQLAVKNDLVVPSPNSTGGSSSTSSISETAIDEELIQVAPDEKIQTSATTNGPNQPVNIMDLLFKAKDRYDKDHSIETNKEEPTKRNDAAANENAQPHFVNFDSSRKVSVASLFSQSNAKPENRTRPSSADMFERRETENTRNSTNTSNQGNRRYAARSLSLSFSNEQFHNAHKNIVNGAISVEELESPVMGKPSRRSRYHSTSEGLVRNGPSPRMPLAEESALSKLFAPVSKTVAKPDNQLATLPQFVSNFSQNLSNSNKASALSQTVISSGGLPPKPPKTLHRSQSIPSTVTMLDSGDPPRKILTDEIEATKAPFASSLPAPLMATLHENPNVAGLVKSMSVASGLAGMNRMPPAMQPVQLAATLHGTAKKDREKMLLLSPHALQPVRNRPRNVQCNNTSDTCSNTTPITATVSLSTVASPLVQNKPSTSNTKTLISPEDFEHSTTTPQKTMELRQRLLPTKEQLSLDKVQLSKVLIHLLQTDQTFVDSIHKAYIVGTEAARGDGTSTNGVPPLPVWK